MWINILAVGTIVLGCFLAFHYGYIASNTVRAMGEIRVGEMAQAARMGDKERIEQWLRGRICEIQARARMVRIVGILAAIGGGVTLVLRLAS